MNGGMPTGKGEKMLEYTPITILAVMALGALTWVWPDKPDPGSYRVLFHVRECGSLEAYKHPDGEAAVMYVKRNRMEDEPEEPSDFTLEMMRRKALDIAEHKYKLKPPIQTRRLTSDGKPQEDWR